MLERENHECSVKPCRHELSFGMLDFHFQIDQVEYLGPTRNTVTKFLTQSID